MLKLYIMLTVATFTLKERALARTRDEEGATTLEYVVIGLGVLLLATGAIAVIKAAVESRTGKIK